MQLAAPASLAGVSRYLFGSALLVCCSLSAHAQETDESSRSAARADLQKIEFERTDDGVWFREAGKPVLFYQAATKSRDGSHARANYIHPLYDLRGKEVLTEDFPDDHRHHRGVFWTWHQTIADGKHLGDAWTTKRFTWNVGELSVASRGDGAAVLTAKVDWTSPDWGETKSPFAREHLRMVVFPKQRRSRFIDFQIRIESLVKRLELGGSDDVKGYGGFSVRSVCPPDITFTGDSGELTPKTTAVEGGDWLTIHGTFGEQPSAITVLTDSRAPRKHDWILRRKRSMQNPRFPGRDPVAIAKGHSLLLHYGLVIHQDKSPQHVPAWRTRFLHQLDAGDLKSTDNTRE